MKRRQVWICAYMVLLGLPLCAAVTIESSYGEAMATHNEVVRIINKAIDSFSKMNSKDYLSLLDEDNFEYVSRLITTDDDEFYFNYEQEKRAIKSTFSRVEVQLKHTEILVKNELMAELSFEMDVLELYDKNLQYQSSVYHIKGFFVFHFKEDKNKKLKIIKIIEKSSDKKDDVSVSFGFVKYFHSDLYSEKTDTRKKIYIEHGEKYDDYNYTTEYRDKKRKKVMWIVKKSQLWRSNIPEQTNTEFVDANGKKITNIEVL